MPIEYRIDHERRLVIAAGHGTVTDADVFGYQNEAWSGAKPAGYDEVVDFTRVSHIALPSIERVRELATLSATMDPPGVSSKLAIVAPADIAYGLGRMFQVYRELQSESTKEVAVFRTLDEARAFLGLDDGVSLSV